MSDLKTKPTEESVREFLASIEAERRQECATVAEIMRDETGAEPMMWGPSIVGFGKYHYRYESGREGDWFEVGFSPRKKDLSLYLMAGFDRFPELMERLGKYRTGRSCLYVRRLSDIDLDVLRQLVAASVSHTREVRQDHGEPS